MNINLGALGISSFQRSDISYLKEMLLSETGELNVLSYEELKDVPQEHLSQFCMENGYYAIPTTELIDFLKEEIGDQKAIEIGSGNGVICRALGIKGTDSFMQRLPEIKAHYEMLQQATVPYGEHVERLDAVEAVRKYKPQIVVAAWCTHKYNPREAWREGNQMGIKEEKILEKVKKYIFVGNEKTHEKKPILSKPHRTIKAEWLLSRSLQSDKNVIYIWE